MFEVSTNWQDGALSALAYLAVVVGVLWILSKIEIKEREGEVCDECGEAHDIENEVMTIKEENANA